MHGVTPVGKRFRAFCSDGCARPLDWAVDTEEHATNVLNKHLREYHTDAAVTRPTAEPDPEGLVPDDKTVPDTLDITAAARAVVDLDHAAATAVWAILTNTSPTDARSLAIHLAERDETITAHTTPF